MSSGTTETTYPATPGVLLAGGLASRMGGGDKPMRVIAGRSILDRAIDRLMPQCDQLVINANGDPVRFEAFGLPVVPDDVQGFAGPLAGILSGLDWIAAHRPRTKWVLTASGDCPFLPRDLVQRLHGERREGNHRIVIAESGARAHPVIALWDIDLRHELRRALTVDHVRKVNDWVARFGPGKVDWSTAPFDPFFNANTPDDLAEAERIAAFADHQRTDIK